ncbi:ATP-binding cassette domain-containing protein [Ferruginibacter lapsinanis]|uniref:ATP-binding cassette domain-containing protein n=1 Tax=Ferruginibacter lapsinanis TaxID=563172 RepID=UPI001E629CD2|nr:ATP-binding cassette domain-containing protein [Ferruginibacter lapsinanis]UEG50384.1 ATP-binding cassette domain-containing protein [Ferruginibacter lapsinanis]
MQHSAIHISNKDNKEVLIQQLLTGNFPVDLTLLKGELYSEISLNQFIDEEIRHDHFEVITGSKNSLQQYSDGEKKKALLSYIISKQPGYIVVDNIFDNLDANAQSTIVDTLTDLSKHTIIIQIANRKSDILSFIKNIYLLEDGKFILHEKIPTNTIVSFFLDAIPPPHHIAPIENDPLVKFNNVTIKYEDRTIVKDINWEINSGEFWQLTGPNGSGKSTLLSLITGDNPKAYGQDLILFGTKKGSGESVWDIKEKIGYLTSTMAQQFSRLDSIEKMVISGFFDSIGLYIVPTDRQLQLARQWLQLIGLYDKRQKAFLSLSLGHQRLILIVRAMVKHPPLLILDEPTAGLDDDDTALFVALVNKIAIESTTAIIYVSHRKEAGLLPKFVFELMPGKNGSTGKKGPIS